MRIGYVAAGAAGMYCGSCLHDNTLAAALMRRGHEVALLPTYTPLRTDEPDVSGERVFYGALNVYLQQKSALFRHLPRAVERWLDRPGLLDRVSRLSASTDANQLGALTLAVLEGEHGPQRGELEKLLAWLRDEYRPDLVQITNSMFLGVVRRLRDELDVPVVVGVQGEDLFIDGLPERWRERVVAEMRRRAADADAFVAPSRWYAAHMGTLLGVPGSRMHVVPLGIRPHESPAEARAAPDGGVAIGYLARVCPEKGLDRLVSAFLALAAEPGHEQVRLRIAGYLGERDRAYFEGVMREVADSGVAGRVEHVGEVDLAGKSRFLDSVDLLCVPTVYREPKGLFALEAMSHGVPVVAPDHGSFPEMIEETGGGILVEPGSPASLMDGLRHLIRDHAHRRELGRRGREAVLERRTDERMADETLALYERLLASP